MKIFRNVMILEFDVYVLLVLQSYSGIPNNVANNALTSDTALNIVPYFTQIISFPKSPNAEGFHQPWLNHGSEKYFSGAG